MITVNGVPHLNRDEIAVITEAVAMAQGRGAFRPDEVKGIVCDAFNRYVESDKAFEPREKV
jgi:hypothetical protein